MERVFLVVVLISLVPRISSANCQCTFAGSTGKNVPLRLSIPYGTTSVWLKRPGSDKYISHCRDGHPIRAKDQEESFKGRVEGMDCNKLSGNVTITLSNLTLSDNGTYEFHSIDGDGRRFNKTICLIVTDPVNPVLYVPGAGVVVCIIIGLIYRGRHRKPQISCNVEEEEQDAAVCPSEKKSPLMKNDSAVVPNVK